MAMALGGFAQPAEGSQASVQLLWFCLPTQSLWEAKMAAAKVLFSFTYRAALLDKAVLNKAGICSLPWGKWSSPLC